MPGSNIMPDDVREGFFVGKRIDYLDILKAIAIFLVVFCHFVLLSETVGANLFMCACWMAVPIFFMVNGALLFVRPLNWGKHLKKTVGVYGVLAAWKLIYMLVIPPLTGGSLNGVSAGEVFNYLFLFGELPGIINGHLWFIEALLAVYAVFPLFRILYDWETADGGKALTGSPAESPKKAAGEGSGRTEQSRAMGRTKAAAHRLTWFFAIASLTCTNGFHSFEVLGDMLRKAGLPFSISLNSVSAFQPFGKYGNMLGFFLLGALLSGRKKPFFGTYLKQRLAGAVMLVSGLFALWGVKWFLSGQPGWDGILLQEGYRHVPVIFMAAGLFLLFKDVTMKQKWLAVFVRAFAARTLGIFYIHWLFGWLLVNPLAAFLMTHGISFGIGSNILKNVLLMVPALLVTMILERIPVVKKLVTG